MCNQLKQTDMKFYDLELTKCGKESKNGICIRRNMKKLRGEIVLNSLFEHHYENSFGLKPSLVQAFFDGYVDYLWELADEQYGAETTKEWDMLGMFDKMDSVDNLVSWYYCHDKFGDENE